MAEREVENVENMLKIKDAIARAGLRQTQVAKSLGVRDASICRVIRGQQRSQKIIDYLVSIGCNPRWFKRPYYPSKSRKPAVQ